MTLRAALKWAQHERWITEVPYIEVPSQPPPRDRWLTRHEADRLIDAAEAPHVELFLSICLWTAARPGAVLELAWDKVDLKAGRIDLGAAPGGKGRAIVPIGQKLMPLLEEAPEDSYMPLCDRAWQQASWQRENWHSGGCPARRVAWRNATCVETCGTTLAMAGIPLDQISRLLVTPIPA